MPEIIFMFILMSPKKNFSGIILRREQRIDNSEAQSEHRQQVATTEKK
jgi:hypothetical protein